MALLQCIAVFLALLGLNLQCSEGAAIQEAKACFANDEKQLVINCGDGGMVRVLTTYYGLSNGTTCDAHKSDCRQLDAEFQYSCIGRSQCSITLPSGTLGKFLPSCNDYSSYFLVAYQCVAAVEVKDICTTATTSAQSGYVSTPHYPQSFGGAHNCTMRVVVNSWQRVRLTIIDLQLRRTGDSANGCYNAWFYVFDPSFGQYTTCQRITNDPVFTSEQNVLQISFESRTNTSGAKGFWIYFEAFPIMASEPLKTNGAIQTTTNGSLASVSQLEKSSRSPTADLIVGIAVGFLGVLLLILIALLLLLIIRRRKMQKEGIGHAENAASSLSAAGDSSSMNMADLGSGTAQVGRAYAAAGFLNAGLIVADDLDPHDHLSVSSAAMAGSHAQFGADAGLPATSAMDAGRLRSRTDSGRGSAESSLSAASGATTAATMPRAPAAAAAASALGIVEEAPVEAAARSHADERAITLHVPHLPAPARTETRPALPALQAAVPPQPSATHLATLSHSYAVPIAAANTMHHRPGSALYF